MKPVIQRSVAIACTACSLLFLPGCWDYKAINTRSPVVGLGIDPAQHNPEKIRVTLQFPILSNSAGGQTQGEGSGETSALQDVSVESYSLSEAFRKIQLKMDREVDIAELRAVVLSGQLSDKALDSAIAQLMRTPKINRLAYILMTPDSAQKILATQGTKAVPLDFVENAFKVRQQGFTMYRELWQYWRDTTQLGVVPVTPIIRTEGTGDGGQKTLAFDGVEVYRNNKPAFALSKEETLYVNFLMGKVRDMSFNIPIGQGVMSLTDLRAKSHVRCIDKGTHLVLVDHVQVSGTLAKIADSSPKPLPPTSVTELQTKVSKYLTQQLTSTLEKLQQQQTDVVGFGRSYLQAHPEEETRLEQQWSSMFQHAKLDIKVNARITSKGMLI
ncbi:Ger(x)C family spore germination protein [Alicyclobacillus tolerans]|uniref:Ger(x)C family spore germination protein n=1 Tax=Alicyclobacillus tolerans TaxID=90970 RepID=UPI001EFF69DF|nr:Ger(x)C family spore germination protein [Alicyclobacillus tolerans]MCF8563465.1 Ger(x)C family spore germination protein [Alicyclobacillus tolerans]